MSKKDLVNTFHDRAREAGLELLKLKITLSTAVIGLMIIVATTKIDPGLTISELIFVLLAIFFAGLSVLFGLLSWSADGARYYNWANCLDCDSENTDFYAKKRDKYHVLRSIYNIIGTVFFSLSILSSIIYVSLRVINNYLSF